MSTNYYWDDMPHGEGIDEDHPRWHIGKRSGDTFIWATDPAKALIRLMFPDSIGVRDERSGWFTGYGFATTVLDSVKHHDYESIGEHFC